MTQDKLNYLLVLAEEQNVTRAARRLYITQPTLTGFLNRLEQDLGFRIFDRQSFARHTDGKWKALYRRDAETPS